MRFPRAWALAFLVVLLLGLAGPAVLSPPAAAGSEPPSVLATAYNTQRKLARTPDGTLYAAITVNASGDLAARVLWTHDGASWSALPPPPTSAGASDRTSLAVDSRGALHLVWTEVTGGSRQVVYARYEGGAWSPKVQLSSSPGYAGFPSVAIDAHDHVHVAWYATDGTYYQIYYRRLESAGWTPETPLTFTSVDATNPAIAVGPDGVVHIVWGRESSRFFLEIAYLRLEGDTVVDTRPISTPDVDAFGPSLVVDSAGTVHVAWDAANRIQSVEASPGWSAPQSISPGGLAARNPSLALDASGRLYAVWEASDGRIYLQTRDGGWSAPVPISAGGVNHYPNARWSQFDNPLCGPNAGIDVVWTEDREGTLRLGYHRIDPAATCPGEAGWPWSVSVVFAIPAIVGATAYVLDRRRRRERPPANGAPRKP